MRKISSCSENIPIHEAYEQCQLKEVNSVIGRNGNSGKVQIKTTEAYTSSTKLSPNATSATIVDGNLSKSSKNQQSNESRKVGEINGHEPPKASTDDRTNDNLSAHHLLGPEASYNAGEILEISFDPPSETEAEALAAASPPLPVQSPTSEPNPKSQFPEPFGAHADNDEKTLDKRIANTSSTSFRFYLCNPHSRGSICYVTPLVSSDTPAVALRGQTVIEFPTILVLPALNESAVTQTKDRPINPLTETGLRDGKKANVALDESALARSLSDGLPEGYALQPCL